MAEGSTTCVSSKGAELDLYDDLQDPFFPVEEEGSLSEVY